MSIYSNLSYLKFLKNSGVNNFLQNLPNKYYQTSSKYYSHNTSKLPNNIKDISSLTQLENYINTYADSPFLKDAVKTILSYYQNKGLQDKEISYLTNFVEKFSDDPWFLNQFSWRMTELNTHLDLALEKINQALNIIDKDTNGIANIIDTKAEVLWKLGEIDDAIKTIDEAILLDPENEYYLNQKEKFISLAF